MATLDANKVRCWRKSSFSYNEDCVECRHGHVHVQVRDSKNAGGPTLSVARAGWSAFLTAMTND